MDNYPNNNPYEFMETPKEREEDEQKEQSRITSGLPVIKEIVDWFESNITHYSGINSFGFTVETPAQTVKDALIRNQECMKNSKPNWMNLRMISFST